ncbi:MAG TPA: transcriptional initiation protein Tat [Casimicrobiaceae bacterium]|nr:transcriptional initiation protein Tat [Casimicrobiaceae bacterium]
MSDTSRRDISQAVPKGSPSPDSKRRRFLMAFGASAAGAASASALAATPAAIVTSEQSPSKSQGYRETEHVRNYYDSTRI